MINWLILRITGMITKDTFTFLKELRKHNTRDWFTDNKASYNNARTGIIEMMEELEVSLNITDVIEDNKLFRINRDVRFSKDKSPYKSKFSGYFTRLGASRRGSYYFSIEPGNTIVGGGFYGPNKEDLFRIRKEFEMDGTQIKKITSNKNFINFFGKLEGDGVATAPRDFDKEHPNIKWIRKKQFYAFRKFTDKEVLDKSFVSEVTKTFQTIRPFFDYMSDILTTDLNGESILKK